MNAINESQFFNKYSPILTNIICFFVIATGVFSLISNIFNDKNPINTIISGSIILCGLTIILLNLDYVFQIKKIIISFLSLIIIFASIYIIMYEGRLEHITPINIFLIGCTFLMITKNVNPWLYQTVVWLVFSTALFSLCNYLNGVDVNNYFIAKFTTMSLTLTAYFLLLSIAILLMKLDDGIMRIILEDTLGGYTLRRIIPFIIIVPILITFVENKGVDFHAYDERFGDSIDIIGFFVIFSAVFAFIASLVNKQQYLRSSAEQKLQESELLFKVFAEKIDTVFYRTNADLSKIIYVSPAFKKIWGYEPEELYKNPQLWIQCIIPEDRNKIEEMFFQNLKLTNTVSTMYSIIRPDGKKRIIYDTAYQINNVNNTLTNTIIGVAVDITETYLQKEQLKTEHKILNIIETSHSIHDAYFKILQIISSNFELDFCELWLVDEGKNVLRCISFWRRNDEILKNYHPKDHELEFDLTDKLQVKIWKEKNSIWIKNFLPTASSSYSMDSDLMNAFGVPLIYQNCVLGVMSFISLKQYAIDNDVIKSIENMAKILAKAMYNKFSEMKFIEQSSHDLLTNLLNRFSFEKVVDDQLQTIKLKFASILLIDIDNFYLINESVGVDNADQILKLFASRIEKFITNHEIILGRLESDKFVIFYKDIKFIDEIINYAQQIQFLFREPFMVNNEKISLSVSIGIANYPQDGITTKELIKNAILTIADAKSLGGKTIQLYSKKISTVALEKIQLKNDINAALLKKQFLLYFQPQVDLKTNTICGVEALLRWQHPKKGLITPDLFLYFAEEFGLIKEIDEFILRSVCNFLQPKWTGPPISVNISAYQLKDKFHFLEYIEQLISEFQLNPKNIEFEITESYIMQNTQHNIAILAALHHLGFNFAIDDFGTGYSSFSYLPLIPANKIKIDRCFIQDLPSNDKNVKIVKSIINLAHSLDMKVIAEGAEKECEVNFLKQVNCDAVQGF